MAWEPSGRSPKGGGGHALASAVQLPLHLRCDDVYVCQRYMLVEVQSYGRIHDVYPQSGLKPVVNASEGVFDLSSGHMVHHKPSGCVLVVS